MKSKYLITPGHLFLIIILARLQSSVMKNMLAIRKEAKEEFRPQMKWRHKNTFNVSSHTIYCVLSTYVPSSIVPILHSKTTIHTIKLEDHLYLFLVVVWIE